METRTVDIHIVGLRRKIEPDPANTRPDPDRGAGRGTDGSTKLLPLRSRNAAFAAYGVLLVLPTLVFGGMYWRLLVRDYEMQLEEAPDVVLNTAEQLAKGIRDRLDALVEREERRPFTQYAGVFSPLEAVGDELALQVSPIERQPTPEGILGWFSYDRVQWPTGPVETFFGSDRHEDELQPARDDLIRAAFNFREMKEEAGPFNRATQMAHNRTVFLAGPGGGRVPEPVRQTPTAWSATSS